MSWPARSCSARASYPMRRLMMHLNIVTSVRRAFSLLYQGIAKVVDEQYQTFDFDEWSQLAVARDMDAIGTSAGTIRWRVARRASALKNTSSAAPRERGSWPS